MARFVSEVESSIARSHPWMDLLSCSMILVISA